MDSFNELPLSLSFASTSYQSIGSSSNHEGLLLEPKYDNNDAEIVVEGNSVGVNMDILAARSQFFRRISLQRKSGIGKPKYVMSALVPHGVVGFEAFKVILNYMYTGNLQPPPQEVSICVDNRCPHEACGASISYFVELMYASSTFQLKERRLLDFVEKALVEDVIPILVVAFHCQLSQLLSYSIQRVARSRLDNVTIEKELPLEVSDDIKSDFLKSLERDESSTMAIDSRQDKRLRKFYMALDTEDVELVKLLLHEYDITLDDVYALHYAVAYCDPKVVKDVLFLDLANINLRNARGHTVLHVAVRRRHPAVLLQLLDRGASVSEITSDGDTAVAICRRLTRPKDFYVDTELGQEMNEARMCIDLLEREMCRSSISGSLSIISEVMADFHVRLNYLEKRVALARLLFPAEAKHAMEMANAYSTLVDTGHKASRGSSGNLREFDLNETPSGRAKRLQERMQALLETVDMGRRFFPNCSEVLHKVLDDTMDIDDFIVEDGTPEEQKNKEMRLELKDNVHKALCKDMPEKNRSVLTPSSSSSSSLNSRRRSDSPFGDSVSSHASSISCWNRWLQSESSFSESVSH